MLAGLWGLLLCTQSRLGASGGHSGEGVQNTDGQTVLKPPRQIRKVVSEASLGSQLGAQWPCCPIRGQNKTYEEMCTKLAAVSIYLKEHDLKK